MQSAIVIGRPGLARRAAAEALGVFALVFAVGGAAAAEATHRIALGLTGSAAVSGLAVTAMVYATGHLSGAHLNPAVTVAFTVTRHFPHRDALVYVAAQLTGAVAAGLVLLAAWPAAPGDLGSNTASVPAATAVLYEVILTALLMFVIVAVATDARAVGAGAALAIGAVVTLDILVGGGVSGASMNPARSFGPALASGAWPGLWVYAVGPLAGALLGAGAYEVIRVPQTPPGSAAA